MSAARGFTLVELVVALAIVALAVGATAANYSRLQQAMAYQSTVRGMLAGLRLARSEAQRSGRPVAFGVDLGRRSYGVEGRPESVFPEELEVRFIVAGSEAIGLRDKHARGYIRFQPEGGATGGSLELRRPQGGGVRLRVDWLLGHVSQERIAG